MTENIFSLRKKIHDIIIDKIFSATGGKKFTDINGQDVEMIFDMYDSKVFGNQIRKKLNKKGDILRFFVRTISSGVGGICGIKSPRGKKNVCEYYIDVSPNDIEKIIGKNKEIIRNTVRVGKIDKIYVLQIILEHEIIHLLMFLWDYLYRDNTEIFSPHGKLYQCVLKVYFGYKSYHKELGLTDVGYKFDLNPSNVTIGMMQNWVDSCFIDSLLVSLFIGASEIPRISIFQSDVSKLDYSVWIGGEEKKEVFERDTNKKEFRSICDEKSNINTEEKTRKYAERLQKALLLDYKNLVEKKEIFQCVDTRRILSECNLDMKKGGRFTQYPVADLYASLCKTFPDLKMWYIPAVRNNPYALEGSIMGKKSIIESSENFMFSQFVTQSEIGKDPDWENFDIPMVVFRNSLNPPIEDYSKTGKEIIKVGNHEFEVEKIRYFSEYIINKRYRLFIVIVNHGKKPQHPEDFGAGHYNAYIRPFFDQNRWYFYDDMRPIFEITNKGKKEEGELPKNIFIDGAYSRPELLFYQKIKDLNKKTEEKFISQGKNTEWDGKYIYIKTIYRPDKYFLISAKDKTVDKSFLGKMEEINPRYDTVFDENTYVWRVLAKTAAKIVEKLKNIDGS